MATNLLTAICDPGFEVDAHGYTNYGGTLTRVTTEHKSGVGAGRIQDIGGAFCGHSPHPLVEPNKLYFASVWVKAAAGTLLEWEVDEYSSTDSSVYIGAPAFEPFKASGGWQQKQTTFRTTSNTKSLDMSIYSPGGTVTFYLDEFELYAMQDEPGFPAILLEADFSANPGQGASSRAYEDLTKRVLSITVRRGRNNELDKFETGSMKVELDNKDGLIQLDGSARPYAGKNLLTLAQSSYEGASPAGISSAASFFTVSGAILGQNTSEPYTRYGFASIRLDDLGGLDLSGWHTSTGFTVASGLAYTFSVWLRGDGANEAITLCIGSSATGSATANFTLTDKWVRYEVTKLMSGSGTAIVAVRFNGSQLKGFYADGLQVEQNTSATDFVEPTPAGVVSSVRPGRRVRFSAFHSGTSNHVHQFIGLSEGWPPLKKHGIRFDTIGINAVDLFASAAAYKLNGAYGQNLVSTRITTVLQNVGIHAEDMAIAASIQTVPAFNYSNVNGLGAIQDLAEAEQGQLYVDRKGKITLENRYFRSANKQTSVATFGEGTDLPYEDIEVTFDWNDILNDVTITREGSTAQVESDFPSVLKYLDRVYTKTLQLMTDVEAEAVAQYILARYKDVHIRVDKIVLDPTVSTTVETHVLERDISDRITIKFKIGTAVYVGEYHIEQVQHNIQPGKKWRTTWSLSPASIWQFWVLDDTTNSVLGSTTRVGF